MIPHSSEEARLHALVISLENRLATAQSHLAVRDLKVVALEKRAEKLEKALQLINEATGDNGLSEGATCIAAGTIAARALGLIELDEKTLKWARERIEKYLEVD